MPYFIIAVLIILLVILSLKVYKSNSKIKQFNTLINVERQKQIESRDAYDANIKDIQSHTFRMILDGELYKTLSIMDTTYDMYSNEDEANRELTSCLKLLGHDAIYHPTIDYGRTVDILVDNHFIIEGKLDPVQSDIDRLIGQVEDYLKTPYYIYIILYGKINKVAIERINEQIVGKNSKRISLIYIDNPTRIRKLSDSFKLTRLMNQD